MVAFDPSAAAAPDSGVFGLPHDEHEAAIVLIPVPFAATVSYGGGAERGPSAILAASRQVDLYDHQFGRAYELGIHMLEPDPILSVMHEQTRDLCAPIVARGGSLPEDAESIGAIDAAGELVNAIAHGTAQQLFAAGKIVGVVGGDHSVPFGAIRAAAAAFPGLGVLHVDAHADLRVAYEGFRWSHASIFHNVLEEVNGVARLVQVGIRDFSEDELRTIHGSQGRIVTHFDQEWRRRQFCGVTFDALCQEVLAALPHHVWLSIDIDGLDPALCPSTGTPVPGGLSFAELAHLLGVVVASGRRVVGFDLVEVAPGAGEWDANVGARVLYKLCGAALASRRSS
jgi:agmatinase